MALTVDGRPRPVVLERRDAVQIGIVAGVSLAALVAIAIFGRHYTFFDLKIYHGAVYWWAQGGDLYAYTAPDLGLGFTYPPFAAIAMAPMAVFPVAMAGWINLLASVVVLGVCCWWLVAPMAERHGLPKALTVALAVPVFAALDPFRETFGFGQVNILLAGLVLADLVALRRGSRWAGVGIGLAAAVKVTPALFIVYFVVTKQWRPALTALCTALGATVLGFLIAWQTSLHYWTSVLWQTERVGDADPTPNQSLAGLLARLYHPNEVPALLWLTFALLVVAVGLSRANTAHSEGDELTAFALVGLSANAVSPISWTHHLVWIMPALVVLADLALRRRARRHLVAVLAVYGLFLVAPVWIYEHKTVPHWQDGFVGMLGENSFAIAILVLVTVLPWRPGADPVEPADGRVKNLFGVGTKAAAARW